MSFAEYAMTQKEANKWSIVLQFNRDSKRD